MYTWVWIGLSCMYRICTVSSVWRDLFTVFVLHFVIVFPLQTVIRLFNIAVHYITVCFSCTFEEPQAMTIRETLLLMTSLWQMDLVQVITWDYLVLSNIVNFNPCSAASMVIKSFILCQLQKLVPDNDIDLITSDSLLSFLHKRLTFIVSLPMK